MSTSGESDVLACEWSGSESEHWHRLWFEKLDGLRRDDMRASDDQLGTTRVILLEMKGDEALDHLALAFQHVAMSTAKAPVVTPKAAARDTVCATPALQISFLPGEALPPHRYQ